MSELKKIIIHWTGGAGAVSKADKEHYHFIIDSVGHIHIGNYKPEDNINCKDGKYAKHTGGGNTGAIGVSMTGMHGFKSPKNIGKFPLTKTQCEKCFELVAGLCIKYQILPENVLTHYEFGKSHPESESAGKIDIIFLPPFPEVQANKIGDFIRNKVYWYTQKILKKGRKDD